MSDEPEGDDWSGWRPSFKRTLPTHLIQDLPDRDELAVDPVPLIFSPVETQTGEDLRRRAIGALAGRIGKLRERGVRQRLTVLESRELEESQAATHTLERMAPRDVSALIPASAGDLFSGNLP